ncbi:MAG: FkbM family methyltransferase [Spirulina sp.]
MLSQLLIAFYKIWHGRLHLQGAGLLIRLLAPRLPGLQSFSLQLPEGQEVNLDFRDLSAFYWLNHLLGDHFEEQGLLASISNHIQADTTLWDVGANCGLLSYQIAKETPVKSLYFFEPNPAMFALAQTANQPFPKVQGLPYALSDQNRTATLTIPEGRSATGTLEASPEATMTKMITIECRVGDQLIKDDILTAPQIIKIDTEGHEISVLKGLKEVIKLASPMIFFEHISLTDDEILSLIPDAYDIYSVSDKDGSLTLGFDRMVGHNSVLKPRKSTDKPLEN